MNLWDIDNYTFVFLADYVTDRLFWADAKLHIISSCDLNGRSRSVILTSFLYLQHPFSITVFEVGTWKYLTSQAVMHVHCFVWEETMSCLPG